MPAAWLNTYKVSEFTMKLASLAEHASEAVDMISFSLPPNDGHPVLLCLVVSLMGLADEVK